MTAASDDQIVEALRGQVVLPLTGGRYRLDPEDARHLAEVIEPIIKRRIADAIDDAADDALTLTTDGPDSSTGECAAWATWLRERADRTETTP